jgi:DNA-binding transcriptional MerR regulator
MLKRRQAMPEKNGYKTIDLVAKELGITEDEVRTLVKILNIQSATFPDDRRLRYYSPQDVERLRKLVRGEQ